MHPPYTVLFLCTGNSARSILAEALLNHKASLTGQARFIAYSAGSHPTGTPRPEALAQLASSGIPTTNLRSKSWDEFSTPTAPHLDFIFTVCDNAAAETCPFWPGHPVSAHWGIPDPAAVTGTTDEITRAFRNAFLNLDRRIDLLLALPDESLSNKPTLDQIGQS